MPIPVPKSKGILALVVLFDMTNTVFREVAILISKSRTAGCITIALLIAAVIAFVALSGRYIYIICCKKKNKHETAIALAEMFGALLYFYGDNIGYIIDRYGKALGCKQGSTCAENNRIAATITLGVSLMLFQLLPPWIQSLSENSEGAHTKRHYLFLMLTIIPTTDALFTVVEVKAQTGNFCSTTDESISEGFYGASVFMSFFIIIAYCVLACSRGVSKWLAVPMAFFCWLCLSVYVLVDNLQPLDCFWKCDSFATDVKPNCTYNSILRLALMSVTLILLITLMVIILRKDYDKTQPNQPPAPGSETGSEPESEPSSLSSSSTVLINEGGHIRKRSTPAIHLEEDSNDATNGATNDKGATKGKNGAINDEVRG